MKAKDLKEMNSLFRLYSEALKNGGAYDAEVYALQLANEIDRLLLEKQTGERK